MKIELKEIECKQGAKSLAKILARNVSGDDAKKDPKFKKDLINIFTKNIQSVEGIVCDEKTLKAYEKKGYSEKAARLLVFLTNLYSEIAARVDGFKNARDVEEFFIKKNAKKDIKSSIIYEIAKAFKIEDEVQEILEQDDYISVEKAGKLAKAKVERRYRLTNDEKIKIEEARVRMLERELDEGLGDIMKLVGKGIKKGFRKAGEIATTPGRAVVNGYKAVSKAAKDKVEDVNYKLKEKIEKVFGKDLPTFVFNSKSKSFWQLKNLLKKSSERGNKGLTSLLNYIKDNFEVDNVESLFKTPKLLITFNDEKAMERFIDEDNNLETVVYDLTKGKKKVSKDKLKKAFLRNISYNEMDSNTTFSEGGGFANYIVAFNEEDANSLAKTWRNIIEAEEEFKEMNESETAETLDKIEFMNAWFYLLPPDISELKARKVDYKTSKGKAKETLEDDDEDSKEKKESFIVYKKRIQ